MAPKNIRARKAVSLEDDDEEPVDVAYVRYRGTCMSHCRAEPSCRERRRSRISAAACPEQGDTVLPIAVMLTLSSAASLALGQKLSSEMEEEVGSIIII